MLSPESDENENWGEIGPPIFSGYGISEMHVDKQLADILFSRPRTESIVQHLTKTSIWDFHRNVLSFILSIN